MPALARGRVTVACIAVGLLAVPLAVAGDEVFRGFTDHIGVQIGRDKQAFVQAQTCTEWFYRQRYKQPSQPAPQKTAAPVARKRIQQPPEETECPSRYPSGLDGARVDFNRTQSNLSVSLTFYEFALVGDRNDDGQYNATELRDMLEAFGMSFDAQLAPGAFLATLNDKFDRVRKAADLGALMSGLGTLYDKGYRLTLQDRADLNRISG